jgi:hypothetical protein
MSDYALETLGSTIEPYAKRDAVHIAVVPMKAGQSLRAGQHIGIMGDGTAGTDAVRIGIVDPFLTKDLARGEFFWMLVYPRTITSLRHVWSHPGIPEELDRQHSDASPSENWLRAFAAQYGVEYEAVLYHATQFLDAGEYWDEGRTFDGEYVPDEFWDHYAIVAGRPVTATERGSFFSCSC